MLGFPGQVRFETLKISHMKKTQCSRCSYHSAERKVSGQCWYCFCLLMCGLGLGLALYRARPSSMCPVATVCGRVCSHLYAFGGGGPQRSPDDLLHHIWQQTGCYQKDYTEPGRTAGQHLHEHVVHPLVVQERPGSNKMKSEMWAHPVQQARRRCKHVCCINTNGASLPLCNIRRKKDPRDISQGSLFLYDNIKDFFAVGFLVNKSFISVFL